MTPDERREAKARAIVDETVITELPDFEGYSVCDYCVGPDRDTCDCADFTYRGGRCKHIIAVDIALDTDCIAFADCGECADLPF